MARRKRFYAIATGQAQANLPSIFSLAGPGDTVVWILTERARTWSASSETVLAGRRIASDPAPIRVSDPDSLSPETLKQVLIAHIDTHPDADPVFIATGGPKYMILGVDRAAVQLGIPVAYSDMPRAVLLTLQHPSGAFTTHPLTNPINLEEWLLVNKFKLHSRSFLDVWPNLAPQLAANFESDTAFDTDPAVQRAFLTTESHKAARRREAEQQPPPLDIPEQFTASASFRNGYLHLMKLLAPCRRPNAQHVRAMQKFLHDQARAAAAASSPKSPGDPAAVLRLEQDGWIQSGDRFEESVARRVHRFLESHPAIANACSAAYLNVEVASPDSPSEVPFTELDVAILLKNATLVHLECKCGRDITEPDTYRRLGKLQSVGKSAASLVFTIPMFPDLAGAAEFAHLYRLHQTIVRLQQVNDKLKSLYYTNPRQTTPRICRFADKPPFEVIPFEQALASILSDYVPKLEAAAPASCPPLPPFPPM